jgi:hypothetical protein
MGDEGGRGAGEVRTGEVDLALGSGAADALPTGHLRPGVRRAAVTKVRAAGTVPAQLSVRLAGAEPGERELLDHLRLRVSECADAACSTLARTVLDGWDGAPVALGTIEPGATRIFRTVVHWPAADRDPLAAAGRNADAALRWSAQTGGSRP